MIFTGKKTVLYKSSGAEIAFLPEEKAVLVTLTGFLSPDKYREQALEQIRAIEKHRCCTLIYDLRQMKVIPPEAQRWTDTEWRAMAIKAGVRWGALIMPEDVFGNLTVERVVESIQQKPDSIIYSYFNNAEEARRWVVKRKEQVAV